MADDPLLAETRPVDGAPVERREPRPWQSAVRVGTLLSERYLLKRYLAAGGMGEVWEAEDVTLRQVVALKMIRPDRLTDESARRFQAEVKLARKVAHPNLCRIFEFGQHRIDPHTTLSFLTMELLRGELLSEVLRRRGPLPCAEALSILGQLAAGLDAAHAAGVVHRDLKSQNIFLEPQEGGVRAVITDFGLARDVRAESRITVEQAQLGTPAYMSPEQVEGGEVGPKSDLYSLGIVAYELVTAETPFGGNSPISVATARLTTPPRPISTPGVPRHWDRVLRVALARQPADRFDTAQALVAALESPGVAARLRVPGQRRAPAIAAGLAMLTLVGAAAFGLQERTHQVSDPCPGGVCAPWSGWLSGSEYQDQTEAVMIQTSGEVLMGGYVTGMGDLGCGFFQVPERGKKTAIIAKFNREGICQWNWIGTNPQADYVLRFYRGQGDRTLAWVGSVPPGEPPWFGPSKIVEVDPTGTVKPLPTQGAPPSWEGLAIDAQERITIASVREGFDRDAASPKSVELVRLRADGEVEWRAPFAQGTNVRVLWMDADPNGDLGIIGSFRETVTLGGVELSSQGETDAFMAKVSGVDGRVLWRSTFGAPSDEIQDRGLVADAEGNWYGVGEHGGMDLGQGPLPASIFVIKWSPEGKVLWSRGFGGSSRRDAARRVAINPAGDPVIAGRLLSPQVNFDDHPITNQAGSDVYVLRLDAHTGAVRGVKTWPASAAPARSLWISPTTGNVAIGGRFEKQISFGQTPFRAQGEDGYFASLGVVP